MMEPGELLGLGLSELREMARAKRSEYCKDTISFYLRPFEPVSITKDRCELSCKHCNKHYLGHMHPVDSPEKLGRLFRALKESGVEGVVLSGGSRRDGSVPLYESAEELSKLKKDAGIRLNAHTGVLSREQADLFSKFLDAALTDVIGSRETVSEILGLPYGPEDYEKTLRFLRDAGVPNLSPHIIVGLHYGELKGEFNALKLIRELDVENIVIVVFIPTPGTAMADCTPPSVEDVSRVIAVARLMYPGKDISLSCVRPGGRYRLELDRAAVLSGVNKIAVPSKAAYLAAEELGLEVKEFKDSRCCSW